MTVTPGWYPQGDGRERWWDGTAWSPHERAVPPAPGASESATPPPGAGRGVPGTYSQPYERRYGVRWGLFEPHWSVLGAVGTGVFAALPLLALALLSFATGAVLSGVWMGLIGLILAACAAAFGYDASVGRRLRRHL
ncbi:MAG: DUF2510 domain-containing protein [Demequina sp.]